MIDDCVRNQLVAKQKKSKVAEANPPKKKQCLFNKVTEKNSRSLKKKKICLKKNVIV